METNFDRTFENNKQTFRQKFGIDWSENHQLYLTFLQTIYVANLNEISNNGLGQIISKQQDIYSLLQSLSQKLNK